MLTSSRDWLIIGPVLWAAAQPDGRCIVAHDRSRPGTGQCSGRRGRVCKVAGEQARCRFERDPNVGKLAEGSNNAETVRCGTCRYALYDLEELLARDREHSV